MTNFQAGDIVKRVRGSFYEVREGGVYTIHRVFDQGIELIGHRSNYDPDMFILHQGLHVVNLAVCHEVALLDRELRERKAFHKTLKQGYEEQASIRQVEIDTLEASLSALKTKYNIEG